MTWKNPDNDQIREILEEAKTIAVVGLSANPERTSHEISKIMQESGYKIIPVNPTVDEVLGEKAYDSLTDIKEDIDIINVFRRPSFYRTSLKKRLRRTVKSFGHSKVSFTKALMNI